MFFFYASWESSKLVRLQRIFAPEERSLLLRRQDSTPLRSREGSGQKEPEQQNENVADTAVNENTALDSDDEQSSASSIMSMPLAHLSAQSHHDFIGVIFAIIGGVVGSQSLLLAKSGYV